MGTACSKCNDMQVGGKGLGAAKALDADSSEEDEDDESDEEENNSEEDEEDKREAEQSLLSQLKRGKTKVFKEAIDHATSLGLDEDKILKAEQKLEEHKAQRRREAFEAELKEFLAQEEGVDTESCEEKLRMGKEYGVPEKVLKTLQDKMEELEKKKCLNNEELSNAKKFVEACTRRFIASCVNGRPTTWLDLEEGIKKSATAWLDLTLKNLKVTGVADDDMICRVADISAKRALEADEVIEMAGWVSLGDEDKENAVAIMGNVSPWCFVEASTVMQDEFICALAVLNGQKTGPRPPMEGGQMKVDNLKPSARGGKSKGSGDKDKAASAESEEVSRVPKRRNSLTKMQSVASSAGKVSLMKKRMSEMGDASEDA